jgi:hypothetical protein
VLLEAVKERDFTLAEQLRNLADQLRLTFKKVSIHGCRVRNRLSYLAFRCLLDQSFLLLLLALNLLLSHIVDHFVKCSLKVSELNQVRMDLDRSIGHLTVLWRTS